MEEELSAVAKEVTGVNKPSQASLTDPRAGAEACEHGLLWEVPASQAPSYMGKYLLWLYNLTPPTWEND